ncbi:MAG: ATP-binding protein [Lawsonibacter sp.]|nr:ATP-binding protein [Lawsonibacter sp.]
MKLTIENFAKIRQAKIDVDGITVIAGENNTGKSTVGKVLYALFNTTSNFEDRVLEQRLQETERICSTTLREFALHNATRTSNTRFFLIQRKVRRYVKAQVEGEGAFSPEHLRDFCVKVLQTDLPEMYQAHELAETLTEKITAVWDIPTERIRHRLITQQFNEIFSGQPSPLRDGETESVLTLVIKEKALTVRLRESACVDFQAEYGLTHQALLIANPFLVDSLGAGSYFPRGLYQPDRYLINRLTDAENEDWDSLLDSMIAEDKMEEINQILRQAVDGDIVSDQDNSYALTESGLSAPVALSNLSTGVKAFVMLKMLLERGVIREKDVVVFDEPEIHLHPQWQMTYAELIVLLQKYFDLSIVVTTHSPYFLDAINLYSIKHKISSKVNYYLSRLEQGRAEFEKVNGKLELIYQKMATPARALDSLRLELSQEE